MGKTGRPKKTFDPAKVEELAAEGSTLKDIARMFGVHVNTASNHLDEEYDPDFLWAFKKGVLRLDSSLQRRQVARALEGDTAMLIWLGKNRLGQTDKQEQRVEVTQHIQPARLTDEQEAQLKAILGSVYQTASGRTTQRN